jgi:integrase/recombinase XerD
VRRHEKDCPHKAKGRKWQKCRCPIWVDWTIDGKRIRKPIGLRDWQAAQQRARQWEAEGVAAGGAPVTIQSAGAAFIKDAEARGLRETTLFKYRLLFSQLERFAETNGLVFITSLNLEWTRKFRESWTNRNLGARKKLEYLRAFFRFCMDSDWLTENPARKIKPPTTTDAPTLPLSDAEIGTILQACDAYQHKGRAQRMRALILLLRHSGLRIGDAVSLARDRIIGDRLELYTARTGTKVYVPLPPEVVEALNTLPRNGNYFFWSGESKVRTITGVWQAKLRKLFVQAGLPEVHPHRFRHTFAVSLLLRGVPMERVSILLGHRSIRVTERHYAAWVAARQEQLEKDVRATWQVPTGHTPSRAKSRARVGHVRN